MIIHIIYYYMHICMYIHFLHFPTEEAKVAVHSSLLLLLGQLAVLSKFGREGLLLGELMSSCLELLEDPELLLLLVLLEPELFFLLSIWLLGFTDLSDYSALLELVVFLQLISE